MSPNYFPSLSRRIRLRRGQIESRVAVKVLIRRLNLFARSRVWTTHIARQPPGAAVGRTLGAIDAADRLIVGVVCGDRTGRLRDRSRYQRQ